MTSLILSNEEIAEITGRKKRSCQRAALNMMGIDFKARPDGSIVVLRSHLNKIMGGEASALSKQQVEPNWDMVNA